MKHRFDLNRMTLKLTSLLIVVAIVAIPNFLAAQTQAKVARTEADKRAKATATEAISLARPGEAGCVIVTPPQSKVCLHTAGRLQAFIEKACGQAPQVREQAALDGKTDKLTVVAIGAAKDFTGLEKFDVAADLSKVDRDGFVLKTVSAKGRKHILAVGKSEKGAANAAWRLMREIEIKNRAVAVGRLAVVESPFIKTREPMILDPWVRVGHSVGSLEPKLRTKYCLRNWDEARIRTYVDLLDSLGYNSVQLNDCWLSLSTLQDTTREQWRDKLRAMAEQAHRNGQTVALFVYGSSVKDLETGKDYTFPGACFNDPTQRQVLLREYDYQAGAYAPCVDRIVTHWGDWGGCPNCSKCTIRTALEQHNLIAQKFREKNPAVESAFSLWQVSAKTWPGYQDDDSILKAGILPRDVVLAVPRKLDFRRVQHIAEAGYKAGVWSWNVPLDLETREGLHVFTKAAKSYFDSFPPETSRLLEWYSVQDGSHFLILQNLYVAAQLMWDPGKSESQLLRQFTRGMFGRENEEKTASALEAVETIGRQMVGEKAGGVAWRLSLSLQAQVTSADLDLIRQAQATLAQVEIAPDFVPAFPPVIPPRELLKEMRAQVDALATYVEFLVGVARLRETKTSGETAAGLKKAFQALPKVPAPEEYLTRYIHEKYLQDLKALRKDLKLPPAQQ